jgi:mycothiol synthase
MAGNLNLQSKKDGPMPFTHRPYAGEDDYAKMRGLLIQAYALNGPPDYCSVGDLDWWRWGPGGATGKMQLVELWWDEQNTLVGMAWPDATWGNDVSLDLLNHPAHPGVIEAMLKWAEKHQHSAKGEAPLQLATWAFSRDQKRILLLRLRGYAPGKKAYLFLGRDLAGELSTPPLPPSYTIRHVQGETDFPERVEVHRDAFAPSRLTVDMYRKLAAEAPTYRPELDLVVVAPDDTFAAYCLVWFDAANKIGVFEPVGCHSAHRRKGLTRAVMVEGLRRLQALGAKRAFVNTLRGEPAANTLYKSVGFDRIDDNEQWKKVV